MINTKDLLITQLQDYKRFYKELKKDFEVYQLPDPSLECHALDSDTPLYPNCKGCEQKGKCRKEVDPLYFLQESWEKRLSVKIYNFENNK